MAKTIQDYKKDATLNKVFRYPEGIMTRREWLKMYQVKGCTVEEYQKPMLRYNRIKYNRLTGAAQDEYEKKCDTMIPGYRLNFPDESFIDITKTEFEYFQDLQLSEDINTQKMELSYKIDASIATDEEIREDEEKELEYFRKYAD